MSKTSELEEVAFVAVTLTLLTIISIVIIGVIVWVKYIKYDFYTLLLEFNERLGTLEEDTEVYNDEMREIRINIHEISMTVKENLDIT